MFQLNNKKIIVILSSIAIIFMGITMHFVMTAYSNKIVELNKINLEDIDFNDDINLNNEPISTKYALKDRYETYNENSLVVNKVYDNYSKLKDFKVEGLKNKEVENKINKEISALIKDGYGCEDGANFSNVLSITCSKYDSIKRTYDNNNLYYNLIDGSRIKLSDIFVDGFNPNMIIANSIYEKIYNYMERTRNSAINYENHEELKKAEKELEKLEKETIKYFNEYKKGNYEFSFDSTCVYFNINGQLFEWYYTDKIEVVAIFKRFLTEDSLFTDDTIGKRNINIGIEKNGAYTRLFYEKLADNIYLDVMNFYGYKEKNLSEDEVKKMIYGITNKYLSSVSLSSDEAIIISGNFLFIKSEQDGYYHFGGGECSFSSVIIQKKYFDNLFPTKIIDIMQEDSKYNHHTCPSLAKSKEINTAAKKPKEDVILRNHLVNLKGEVIISDNS